MLIREVKQEDAVSVFELYKIVTKTFPGHLTLDKTEVTLNFIKQEIDRALKYGLMLVWEKNNKILGFVKAYTSIYKCLAHTLTNATIMMHPEYQNNKYGTTIVLEYLKTIQIKYKHIHRFELLPHETNQSSIKFYERIGFKIEASSIDKIMNPKKFFEKEITLTWFNPAFNKKSLFKYYQYLSTNYLK